MSPQPLTETPIVFECRGERLIGIATHPVKPSDVGVLIIVGGPQYRSGSHRQFTLLARRLAREGYASFRFDYRGMGDSEGEFRNFEAIDDDIRAAIDAFMTADASVRKVALWGLCDAASAALYYGHTDPRVAGQILLNPWTHSPAGEAKARLKHYYLKRILQKSFWIKLLTGGVRIGQSMGDLRQSAHQASAGGTAAAPADPRHGGPGYIDRMLVGLKAFSGRTHFILSGEDLVAQEFQQRCKDDAGWKRGMKRASTCGVAKANHTFSSAAWRAEAERHTLEALQAMRG